MTNVGEPNMADFYDPNDKATTAFFVEQKADETIGLYQAYLIDDVFAKIQQSPSSIDEVLRRTDVTNIHAIVPDENGNTEFKWDVHIDKVIAEH